LRATIFIIAIALALSASMAVAWAIALRTGKSGWIDAVWSFAVGVFGVVASLFPLDDGPFGTRQMIVATLAAFWSGRLGLHIAGRTLGVGDDPRYAELKRQWGHDDYPRRLFGFLQIQAAAGFILVISIMSAARNPADELTTGDWIGIVIFFVALCGEALADLQLSRFRADPANKGKVCDSGVWRYSRHPNYFFEWLAWVAYVPIAINWPDFYYWGWVAISGPVLMYWLLVHASGIPPLETHMLRSRGERFRAYQATVNAFWPGPRRTGTAALGRGAP
jgi:steroid 5-alpha reductase family enzyme